MSWISITKASVYNASIGALIDACDMAALATGQTNRSDDIIQGVVDDVRRKVASCRRNLLDQDVTAVPFGLKNHAQDMVVFRLKIAVGMELSEDERRTMAARERDLNRVASCEDVVDQPDTPIAAGMEPTVVPPTFGWKPREFTDRSQNG